MRDSNQTPRDDAAQNPDFYLAPPDPLDPAVPPAALDPALASAAPEARRPGITRALLLWLGLLLVFGAGGLLLGQQELALLAAFAGIYVTAHAADVDRGWSELYYWLSWIVPMFAFLSSIVVAIAIWQSDLPYLGRGVLVMIAAVAAGLSILSVPHAVADRMARALFHEPRPGHVLRTTARCVVLALALAIPGWFAAQALIADLLESSGSLIEQAGLSGGLLGYVLFAFAGAGFLIRRDFRGTAERLGLRMPGGRDLLVALGALVALWLLNHGADLLQQKLFPELWASDQRITRAIASGITPGRAVLLGLSAGIGEEITLRGGLQPRLGIPLTALFFATLHVQYSWFGLAVIFLLGALLGVVRKRSSTTTAILAHVVYDVIAVLGK